MISLCKTVHLLLGLPDSDEWRPAPAPTRRCSSIRPPDAAEGLRLITGDPPITLLQVVESSIVGPAAGRSPGSKSEEESPGASDPGGWGLYAVEDRGGMGLCTEGLGSESCDDRIAAEKASAPLPSAVSVGGDEDDIIRSDAGRGGGPARPRRRRAESKFPPPLPWLAGRRNFLKGVRTDGRLQLTEVTIERRPEILRASRQNGRLRLEIVKSDPQEFDMSRNESEEESEASIEEEEENEVAEMARWGGLQLPRWEELQLPRCQGAAVGGNGIPQWWNHRFVTTA